MAAAWVRPLATVGDDLRAPLLWTWTQDTAGTQGRSGQPCSGRERLVPRQRWHLPCKAEEEPDKAGLRSFDFKPRMAASARTEHSGAPH